MVSIIFICDNESSRKRRLLLKAMIVDEQVTWMNQRRCFALDLNDDPEMIAEYERFHAPGNGWPEVIAHIRATGVESMEIWRTGDRLLMITEVADDYPRAVDPPPEVARWEELMWRFQRPLPNAAKDEKWVPMRRIFSLSEQP